MKRIFIPILLAITLVGCALMPAAQPRAASATCVNASVENAAWLKRCDSTASSRWALTAITFNRARDDPEIHVLVLNEDGSPASGVKVLLDTGVPEDIGFELTRAGSIDFLETGDSSFHNESGESGPYCVYVDGASDRACGMGLLFPRSHNSTYYVTFRFSRGAVTPTATPLPVPGQTLTPAPDGGCDVLPKTGILICKP